MKISIDVDCSPAEARAFLGLPDLKPTQDALMAKLQERLQDGLAAADVETLMKTWLPAGVKDLGDLQKALWAQFMGGGGRSDPSGEDKT